MIRRRVDLPQPDGPTIETNSPRRISASTGSSARKPESYVFETPLSETDAPVVMSYLQPGSIESV